MKHKKGGRHSVESVEKRKNNKRAVLSYEDVPLEEYSEESIEVNRSAVKKIVIAVGVLVLLGLLVYAIANSDSLTPEKIYSWFKYDVLGSGDTGYPVEIIGTNVNRGNFVGNGDITYVSDTSFVTLSQSGNEICYNQHSFSKPVLTTEGDNAMIYNLGGSGYVTGTVKELGEQTVTDDELDIIAADINERGYYCLVTQADGYLSKISVYNNDKEKFYTYSFADYYINAVSINPDGTGCVACGVTADAGSISGIAYVLDFSKKEPRATYSLDENTVYSVDYLSAGNVCIIGSNSAYALEIGSSDIKQIDYSNMQLTAFDVDKDTDCFALSLSRSGDGNNCSIHYLNSIGNQIKIIDTKNAVESLSLFKNRVAFLDKTECYLYDTDANLLGSSDAGNGAKCVRLNAPNAGYILGINEVRRTETFE